MAKPARIVPRGLGKQIQINAIAEKIDDGAEGGSRTRTSFRTTDFKSAASAIPPPRHVVRNPNSTKPFRFSLIINTVMLVGDEGKMRDCSIRLSLELNHLTDWFDQLFTATSNGTVNLTS
jgi:hypothetical protein